MKRITFVILAAPAYLFLNLSTSFAQPGKAQSNTPIVKSTFAGKESGNITKEELLSDSVVKIIYADSLGTHILPAVSFRVSIIAKGRNAVLDIPSDGNKMPQRAKDMIMTMHAGDKLIIDYVGTGLYRMSAKNKGGTSIPHRVPLGGEPIAFTIAGK